jgi:hypothetical protein
MTQGKSVGLITTRSVAGRVARISDIEAGAVWQK